MISATDPRATSPSDIYQPSPTSVALQQGEIISGLYQWVPKQLVEDMPAFKRQPFPYTIALSQSCDLEWDHDARKRGVIASDKLIPTIHFALAYTALEIRNRKGDGAISSDKWSRLRRNDVDRFHFFELVRECDDAAKEGLPELTVDFKRYFSLTTPDVYWQLERNAARRTRLRSPYLEHFAMRFFHFQSRVAIPHPHFSA